MFQETKLRFPFSMIIISKIANKKTSTNTSQQSKRNMIFYHQSPLHFYPSNSFSWSPYIITPTASSTQRRCGINKKQKICDMNGKSTDHSTKIIYEDRSTRIQHIEENKVEFSLDLPGIKASDTTVEIHNGILKVIAERKHDSDRTTKVERSFSVKDIVAAESDDLHASLKDGVLRITIPKKLAEENTEEATSLPISVGVEYPLEENNEKDDSTKIRFSVDLPGVSLSNLKLDVKNDTISLLATRNVFGKESTTRRHFTIDTDKVDNTSFKGFFVDGVLKIIGSKKVLPGPKHIVVADGSSVDATVSIENAIENKEDDMVIVETVTE